MKLKSIWLAGLAVLAVLLIAAPTAFAGIPQPPKPPKAVKPPKPPKPPKETPAPAPIARVSLSVVGEEIKFVATGLDPAIQYRFAIEVWGCGNPDGYYRGGSFGHGPTASGVFTIIESLAEIRKWAAPYPLHWIAVWLEEPDMSYYDVATYPDGERIYAEKWWACPA